MIFISEQIFMKVDEVAAELGVSNSYAYKLIRELTEQKKAVILVSPEMDELIGLCNRIYIMYEGAIMDEVSGNRKTQEVIINNLLGVQKNE